MEKRTLSELEGWEGVYCTVRNRSAGGGVTRPIRSSGGPSPVTARDRPAAGSQKFPD